MELALVVVSVMLIISGVANIILGMLLRMTKQAHSDTGVDLRLAHVEMMKVRDKLDELRQKYNPEFSKEAHKKHWAVVAAAGELMKEDDRIEKDADEIIAYAVSLMQDENGKKGLGFDEAVLKANARYKPKPKEKYAEFVPTTEVTS